MQAVTDPGGTMSLARACWELSQEFTVDAEPDPVLALGLAVDFLKAHPRGWRGDEETVEQAA